eukprot:TRINITY_DN7055_c0_g1_i1.p1 TRINITY_DN7055_c0_g1~~TRINITY_DN7055_c0_g1_i1.p1  ORF type:complete len:111 (-),score=57.31 TRINITY_DN7055_c0_g1_i1:11-343(-)
MLFFLMIRRPPRSTQSRSSAASDVYKRQGINAEYMGKIVMEQEYETGNSIEVDHQSESQFVTFVCISDTHNKHDKIKLPKGDVLIHSGTCLLYTSPSPRDRQKSRMPSSA